MHEYFKATGGDTADGSSLSITGTITVDFSGDDDAAASDDFAGGDTDLEEMMQVTAAPAASGSPKKPMVKIGVAVATGNFEAPLLFDSYPDKPVLDEKGDPVLKLTEIKVSAKFGVGQLKGQQAVFADGPG
jgi:hypothetical protein